MVRRRRAKRGTPRPIRGCKIHKVRVKVGRKVIPATLSCKGTLRLTRVGRKKFTVLKKQCRKKHQRVCPYKKQRRRKRSMLGGYIG